MSTGEIVCAVIVAGFALVAWVTWCDWKTKL